jgi:hypothetical protein
MRSAHRELGVGECGPPFCNPYRPVLNCEGVDIRPLLENVAAETHVPTALVLACAITESGLNPQAKRWGIHTREARTAIATHDWERLAWVIAASWPDIGFGYGGQLVLSHYLGDYAPTVENCLTVRSGVFANPEGSLQSMAQTLAAYLHPMSRRGLDVPNDDRQLTALLTYRRRRWLAPDRDGGRGATTLIDSSRAALGEAAALLG